MTDPRTTDPRRERDEQDVRPIVERPRGGLSTTAIIALAVVLGLVLFTVLEARRETAIAPAVSAASEGTAVVSAPPPLYLPASLPAPLPAQSVQPPTITPPPNQPRVQNIQPIGPVSRLSYQPVQPVQQPQPVSQRNSGGAALVIDSSQNAANSGDDRSGSANALAAPTSTGRVRAGAMANRATTVTQGTLIPAVLETAFDSTRPGFARALVQRDIRGFDGTQVLIPRGSRLIGEYAADTAQGQNRAMIAWSRLIRPDGVTIAIGSPVADPVGRGGVKASVNSHFFQRFAGAILQSTLDIGVNLASRTSGSPTIVALPGSLQGSNIVPRTTEVRPTLRVAQGTSVSVFVARDLDFTDADAGQ